MPVSGTRLDGSRTLRTRSSGAFLQDFEVFGQWHGEVELRGFLDKCYLLVEGTRAPWSDTQHSHHRLAWMGQWLLNLSKL